MPEFVEAVRLQTRTSLLLEGTRSSQRPGLPREHVKIMFEIQNLLVSPVTTLMLRHGTTVMPKRSLLWTPVPSSADRPDRPIGERPHPPVFRRDGEEPEVVLGQSVQYKVFRGHGRLVLLR